jgi:hypothetical protein
MPKSNAGADEVEVGSRVTVALEPGASVDTVLMVMEGVGPVGPVAPACARTAHAGSVPVVFVSGSAPEFAFRAM